MDFKTEFKNFMNNYEQKGGNSQNTLNQNNLKKVKLPPLIIIKKYNSDKTNNKIYKKLDKYIFEDTQDYDKSKLTRSETETEYLSEEILNNYRKYHIQLSDSDDSCSRDSYLGNDITTNIGMQIAAGN